MVWLIPCGDFGPRGNAINNFHSYYRPYQLYYTLNIRGNLYQQPDELTFDDISIHRAFGGISRRLGGRLG